jgi:hypothetical protein
MFIVPCIPDALGSRPRWSGVIHRGSGFIRSTIGPWQHGQVWGYRTLIVQISQ